MAYQKGRKIETLTSIVDLENLSFQRHYYWPGMGVGFGGRRDQAWGVGFGGRRGQAWGGGVEVGGARHGGGV